MDESQPTETIKDPKAALEQTLALLKARDDTSRFVGLSLLRSLLDSNEQLRSDTAVVTACWIAIPNTFLVRLVSLQSTNKKSVEETTVLVQLAISVIHLFANLLPQDEIDKEKMTDLCHPLVHTISKTDPESQSLVFQTLQCIASSRTGAVALISVQGWKDLVESVEEKPEYYLKELSRLFGISVRDGAMLEVNLREWHVILGVLIEQLQKANPVLLIETLAELTAEMPYLEPPAWPPDAKSLLPLLRSVIMKRPTTKIRHAVVTLVATLLRGSRAGSDFPELLFHEAEKENSDTSQPFSYIFVNLLLIDIRATIPSLIEILASPDYATTAVRLAASYDIASSFILYLLQHLESDADCTEDFQPSVLPPDLLLKLRRDFSETFSLTLEFFRDRWEATVSGVSGLDPSARIDPNAPLTLTWDNPSVSPSEDPIILSGLRALSLWLREDDNPELRDQAIGIMDMLIPLYSSSGETVDFRHPILTALSGIFPYSEDAVQAFLSEKGWDVLSEDLAVCFTPLDGNVGLLFPARTQDLIRVLLMVVESDAVPQAQQSWMKFVRLVGKKYTLPSVDEQEAMDTLIGGWQLAVALVLKAPKQVRKGMSRDVEHIKSYARQILEDGGVSLNGDSTDGLMEVIEGFEEAA